MSKELDTPVNRAAELLGQIDRLEDGAVVGWVAEPDRLEEPLKVELLVDGAVVLLSEAGEHRQDVQDAGIGRGMFGFRLAVPHQFADGVNHMLEVRVVESGFLLKGGPVEFLREPDLSRSIPLVGEAEKPASQYVVGFVDDYLPDGVVGWAARPDGSHAAVEVKLVVDGRTVAKAMANLHRSDLSAASIGSGYHAFRIAVPEELFDDQPHVADVQESLSGDSVGTSPCTIRFNACDLWSRSVGDEEIHRRELAGRALSYCEGLGDDAANTVLHETVLGIRDWLETQPPTRNLQRAQALLQRFTAMRCRVSMEGFRGPRELSGAVSDAWGSAGELDLELLEADQVVASTTSAPGTDANGNSAFMFELPDRLLDEDVHELHVQVRIFGGRSGPWSFLLGVPDASGAQAAQAATEPVWETLPVVRAMRKNKPRKPPTAVEQARLALVDAMSGTGIGERDPKAMAALHCRLAQALADDGAYAEALQQFRDAYAADDRCVDAIVGEVKALAMAGDHAGGMQRLARALEDHPDERALVALVDDLAGRGRIRRARTVAFYLPQFHPTPENDKWWGKGFTEWANVTSATPLFDGHLQPRRPTSLGYYDLRLAESANAQFELARRFGIDGFCYYFYWFNGRRILQRPLEDLAGGRTGPFPFCICWANEPWTRSWDGATGEVLMAQNHTPESDFDFIKDVASLLRHPDYIRVDGKPVLMVYRVEKLATPEATAQRWREWCRAEGIGELHLCAVQSFGFGDPRPYGFDAAVEFPPHAVSDPNGPPHREQIAEVPDLIEGFRGHIYNYQSFANAALRRPREPYMLHRTAMVAWDNTARRGKTADVFHRFTLATFERWVQSNARHAAVEQTDGISFINAWNEWAEGSTMEPEARFGYEILAATRRAARQANFDPGASYWRNGYPLLTTSEIEDRDNEPVVLVGHDAHPSGAQTNMLYMARSLKRQIGANLQLMLVEGGELLGDYERVAPTFLIGRESAWRTALQAELRSLRALGFRKAICNTVVTGDIAEVFKQEGYRVVGLIHEMPALIESYNLQPQCWRMAEKADNIVFASSIVANQFTSRYWPDFRKVVVAPQGINFNRYWETRDAMRLEVRRELKLPPQCDIVLGCGFGDTRKGVDLFIQMAAAVARKRAPESVAFVWVGALEPSISPYALSDIERLGLKDAFRVTGRTPDAARYFIAAEVFALTSREDPFPSVVMEAMDASLPVVAFDGAGGYVDIVNDTTGALVPYLDVVSMSEAVVRYLAQPQARQRVGESNHHLSRDRFGYAPYMRKLLALLDGVPASSVQAGELTRQPWPRDRPRPSVSVIVPNFNYARYLELRLRTIFEQTFKPDEIIVLDDGSSDESVTLISEMAKVSPIPMQVIVNDTNTGNPFEQWAKGLAMAKGELVWIAEADDYCEPTLLETLVRELADPAVSLAWTDSIMVDGEGRGQGYQYKQYYMRNYGFKWNQSFRMPGTALVDNCLLAENIIPNASAVVFRRSAVPPEAAIMREHRFSGDWWFWLCLARHGDMVYRAEPLNYHRRHKASVMGAVLKNGTKLMQETLAFYGRVQRILPEFLTPESCLKVVRRVKELEAEFLASDDLTPVDGQGRSVDDSVQAFARTFIGGVRSRTVGTEGEPILVLSDDVLRDGGTGLSVLRHMVSSGPTRLVLLLTGAADPKVIDVCADLAVALAVIDLNMESPSKADDGEGIYRFAVRPEQVDPTLAQVLETFGPGRLVSHGLLAHAALAGVTPESARSRWTLVAGAEFNPLLGQLPRQSQVTVDRLRAAIQRCGSAQFVGEAPPHVFATMALPSLVPIERLHLQSSGLVAGRQGSVDKPIRCVVLGTWGTAEEWKVVAGSLREASSGMSTPVQLRFLAWGAELARLRKEMTAEQNVEVVELYGRPGVLSALGDIIVLPGGAASTQDSVGLQAARAGMLTCTLDALLDARACRRLVDEALRRASAGLRKALNTPRSHQAR